MRNIVGHWKRLGSPETGARDEFEVVLKQFSSSTQDRARDELGITHEREHVPGKGTPAGSIWTLPAGCGSDLAN